MVEIISITIIAIHCRLTNCSCNCSFQNLYRSLFFHKPHYEKTYNYQSHFTGCGNEASLTHAKSYFWFVEETSWVFTKLGLVESCFPFLLCSLVMFTSLKLETWSMTQERVFLIAVYQAKSGLLNISTFDILGQIMPFLGVDVLCMVGCLVASLAFTHQMPVVPPQ